MWLSVLPALGIQDIAAWGRRPDYTTTHFAGKLPGLRILTESREILESEPEVVFVSGSARFVKEICSGLRGVKIWATCPALRKKRLGVLAETDLRWKHVAHVQVGGVTAGG